MEVLSTAEMHPDPDAICDSDCKLFSKTLKNVILSIARHDMMDMWIQIEKCLRKYEMMFYDPDGTYSMEPPCSLKICHVLLRNMEGLKAGDIKLSTVITCLMSVIYLKDTECFCTVTYTKKLIDLHFRNDFGPILSAFQGRPLFMKILLNFGLLKSLPQDSSFVFTEACNYIRDFM